MKKEFNLKGSKRRRKSLIWNKNFEGGKNARVFEGSKRTTPGIPTWSPTVVLTRPDDA